MDIKEAIKILHPDTTAEALVVYTKKEAMKVVEEACVVACEALEKQIPMKTIKVDSGVYDYPFDYECPYCRENVDELDHHCNCGQALDWSADKR